MKDCYRCGIDIPDSSLLYAQCVDCDEVEPQAKVQGPATVTIVNIPGARRGYKVYSSRRGPMPADLRAHLMAEVVRLTERHESANRIALMLGISTRTVQRFRAAGGVTGAKQHCDPRLFYRDPDAAWEAQQRALAEWRRRAVERKSA